MKPAACIAAYDRLLKKLTAVLTAGCVVIHSRWHPFIETKTYLEVHKNSGWTAQITGSFYLCLGLSVYIDVVGVKLDCRLSVFPDTFASLCNVMEV